MRLSTCRIAATATVMAMFATAAQAQVAVDVVGHMSVGQFNSLIAPQSYRDWGNEPFIAVNPLNPNQMVVSGFAYSTNSTSQGAALWYSTNGGANWDMTFPFQAPAAGILIPRDQTFAYDNAGTLHAVMLGGSSLLNVYHGTTNNPAANASALWTAGTVNQFGANHADQPWMAISGNHVYVGYDDFTSGATERVARSDDGGATFAAANDLVIGLNAGTFTNPGTRIAADDNGNAYSIIGIGTAQPTAGLQTVTYRLNSYRIGVSGGAWDHTGDTPAPGGILIDSGNSHQINFAPTYFGKINDLRGNITAIASDGPGSHIYVVYGKLDGAGVDRLFIEEFHPGAGGALIGSGSRVFSVPGQRSALPTITVLDNGTVCVEYQSYVGADGDPLGFRGQFQVHLAYSTDGGVTWTDNVFYTYTAQSQLGDPGFGGNRMLGDYTFMESIGNTVYGTFAGFGNVNAGGIDTRGLVVPFYFSQTLGSQTAVPEPGSLALFGGMLAVVGWNIRRRRK